MIMVGLKFFKSHNHHSPHFPGRANRSSHCSPLNGLDTVLTKDNPILGSISIISSAIYDYQTHTKLLKIISDKAKGVFSSSFHHMKVVSKKVQETLVIS